MRTNPRFPQQSPGLRGDWNLVDRLAVVDKRRRPVKNLIIAAMIAAFGAAVILPAVIGSDSAYAQAKKKEKKKKKPTGKM
jgi:hypothetical protein